MKARFGKGCENFRTEKHSQEEAQRCLKQFLSAPAAEQYGIIAAKIHIFALGLDILPVFPDVAQILSANKQKTPNILLH